MLRPAKLALYSRISAKEAMKNLGAIPDPDGFVDIFQTLFEDLQAVQDALGVTFCVIGATARNIWFRSRTDAIAQGTGRGQWLEYKKGFSLQSRSIYLQFPGP